MINKIIQNRLVNWKFSDAFKYAEDKSAGVTDEELEVIRSLHQAFSNSGWFEGAMGSVVGAAVSYLLSNKESGI